MRIFSGIQKLDQLDFRKFRIGESHGKNCVLPILQIQPDDFPNVGNLGRCSCESGLSYAGIAIDQDGLA